MYTHAVATSRGRSYFSRCKYKCTRDETWAQDSATWNSLHDARLSRGSMLYNPRERLYTDAISITI